MASIKNESAVDQSQIKSIYKRIIPVNCSWCLSKCTEKISIKRDTMEWCDASRMPTTTLPFCCYECHDEFASNHLSQYYDENLEDEYIPDHIKPKHRRCAQCCTRCTGSISLLKKRTATAQKNQKTQKNQKNPKNPKKTKKSKKSKKSKTKNKQTNTFFIKPSKHTNISKN